MKQHWLVTRQLEDTIAILLPVHVMPTDYISGHPKFQQEQTASDISQADTRNLDTSVLVFLFTLPNDSRVQSPQCALNDSSVSQLALRPGLCSHTLT